MGRAPLAIGEAGSITVRAVAQVRFTAGGLVSQAACRVGTPAEAKAALLAELARRLGDAGTGTDVLTRLSGTVRTCSEARCRFRAPGGRQNHPGRRTGALQDGAQNALLADLKSRRGSGGKVALKPHSTFVDAAKLWIGKVEVKRRGSTHYTYKRWLEGRILPDIGGWRLRECTVGQLDVYFDRLAQEEVIDPTTGDRRRRYQPNMVDDGLVLVLGFGQSDRYRAHRAARLAVR